MARYNPGKVVTIYQVANYLGRLVFPFDAGHTDTLELASSFPVLSLFLILKYLHDLRLSQSVIVALTFK